MGSPLGIVFTNENSGLQTINGGGVNKNYRVVQGKAVKSIFDSGQFSPYPESFNPQSGSVDKIRFAADIHNDESNNIDINSIIKYCSNPKYPAMKLDYAHFAYLKNLGVYPNNRLIIARRFSGGVSNDLTSIKSTPLATIVSWVPESEENFFSIKFNEEYVEADGSFEEVLNEIGEEVIASRDNKGGALGKMVSEAFNIIPLPGLMEGVQLEIMKKMGITGGDFGIGSSPIGNPNIIREAKRRKTPGKGEAGAGLSAAFEIKMEVEYEQKFINGVDPTLVYLDIIQNALTFGTSDAVFQYSSAFATGVSGLIGNLISGDVTAIAKAIYEFVGHLIAAIGTVVRELATKLVKPDDEGEEELSEKEPGEQIAIITAAFVGTFTRATVGHVVSKYKVRLLGIANALTGSPSTPWHVTIGNPKKPIFTSGDLQCTSVELSLGKTLAFNDLPSSIKLTISFQNARNLGAQEIFNRFNTGRGRSYVRLIKSFVEQNDAVLTKEQLDEIDKKVKDANAESDKKTEELVAQAANSNQNGENDPNKKNNGDGKIEKNNQTEDPVKTAKDDYPVDFNNPSGGVAWGLEQSQPPAANNVVTGDATTAKTEPTTETKPSNQSANDPNTTTSNVPPDSQAQPAPTPPTEWEVGKSVGKNILTEGNIRVEWEVKQGGSPGNYDISVRGTGGGSGEETNEFSVVSDEQSAVADAKAEAQTEFEFRKGSSKYTYEILTLGPKKAVRVFKDGAQVYEGAYSFSASVDVLLSEAKLALDPSGSDSNIQNMVPKQ